MLFVSVGECFVFFALSHGVLWCDGAGGVGILLVCSGPKRPMGEVATLEAELAEIARVQKEADKLRTNEKDAWRAAKADFEQGLEGVRMALDVLRPDG